MDLIVNMPLGKASFYDERAIRRAAMQNSMVTFTTMTGANAAASAIETLQEQEELKVTSLQEHHA
jgi:carbamoyl-phosphate synthase large subunit